jgi:hypothetical protein
MTEISQDYLASLMDTVCSRTNTAIDTGDMRSAYSVAKQSNKLRSKEGDWMLPGSGAPVITRTRNGGSGRPSFSHRYVEVEQEDSSDTENPTVGDEVIEPIPEQQQEVQEEEEVGDGPEDSDKEQQGDEVDDTDDENSKMPAASRVFMEVDPLVDFMERNCRCPDCKAGMSATLHTLCLATSMTLSCTNDDCGYVDSMRPPIKANLNKRNRIHREDGKDLAIFPRRMRKRFPGKGYVST